MGLVKLNVGGHIYWTTKDTLTSKGPNMLSSMIQHPNPAKLVDGALFIDRDPEIFRWLLLYFRGSSILPLRTSIDLWLLREEAEFFAVEGLLCRIQHILCPSYKKNDNVMIRGTKCTILTVDKNGYIVTRQNQRLNISSAENVEPASIETGDVVMAWNQTLGKRKRGICMAIERDTREFAIQFDGNDEQIMCASSGVRF